MAGMFYSLQEVAQKLNKTEEEIKELVKTGKIREFRNGPNVLFRINEVEALMSETTVIPSDQIDIAEETKPAEAEEKTEQPPQEPKAEEEKTEEKPPEAEPAKPEEEQESITLAEDATPKADLIGEDTAIIGEETGLDEKGTGLANLEELMVDTSEGASGAPLTEGEEDLSLDTFGSGGLLDVSLQADDTSLGGILDEIYTPEGEAEEPAEDAGPEMEAAIGAEEMFAEEPQPSMEAAAIIPTHVEPAPDTMSNAFGIMLLIPLLIVIYTAIISIASFNDIIPSILQKIQVKNGPYGIHIIWYIMAGAAVVSLLIISIAAAFGGGGIKAEKKPKAKAEKKPKQKKPKKEKKAKK